MEKVIQSIKKATIWILSGCLGEENLKRLEELSNSPTEKICIAMIYFLGILLITVGVLFRLAG